MYLFIQVLQYTLIVSKAAYWDKSSGSFVVLIWTICDKRVSFVQDALFCSNKPSCCQMVMVKHRLLCMVTVTAASLFTPTYTYTYVFWSLLYDLCTERMEGREFCVCTCCIRRCTEKYVFQQGMLWLLDYASNVIRMYNHVFLLPWQPCVSLSVHYLSLKGIKYSM